MNVLDSTLCNIHGLVNVGRVVNVESSQEIRYCYAVRKYDSAVLKMVLIDRDHGTVIAVADTSFTIKPQDRRFYNGDTRKFCDLGHHTTKRKVFYSPLARWCKLSTLAYEYRGGMTKETLITLRQTFENTTIPRLLTPNLMVLLDALKFMEEDTPDLEYMQMLLCFQYYGSDNEMLSVSRHSPKDVYFNQLGHALGHLLLLGYAPKYGTRLKERFNNNDLGKFINLFMGHIGNVFPYTTIMNWGSPLDEHIRYENGLKRIVFSNYSTVRYILGMLQNPWLELAV